jgi:hypothetical protein
MAGIEPVYDSLDANGPPGVRAVTVYVSLVGKSVCKKSDFF